MKNKLLHDCLQYHNKNKPCDREGMDRMAKRRTHSPEVMSIGLFTDQLHYLPQYYGACAISVDKIPIVKKYITTTRKKYLLVSKTI